MKSALLFLIQLLLLGSLSKIIIRMFIPRPIRILCRKTLYKSTILIKNAIVSIHDNLEEDKEDDYEEEYEYENNVVDFDKIKKNKAK